MINIAVCDDNPEERQLVIQKANSFICDSHLKANVFEFQDGEDLIEHIEKNKVSFDIVFLDIYMNCMNGIDTAKKIRQFDSSCNIVFITSSSAHAVESYDVRAIYYLVKPIEDEKLHNALDVSMQNINKTNTQYILVKNNKSFYKLLYQDILYIESKARILLIHTQRYGVITIYNKLIDFEMQLNDKRFLHCHKSYLINLDHVKKIEDASFIMENNVVVPISKSVKDVKNIYMNHLLNRI